MHVYHLVFLGSFKASMTNRNSELFFYCQLEIQHLAFLPGVYRLGRGAVTDCIWSDLNRIFEDRVLTPNKADSRWRLCVRVGRGKIRESTPLASSMGPRCRAQKSTEQ